MAMDYELAKRATEVLSRALEEQGAERAALLDEALRLHRQALGRRPYEPLSFLDDPDEPDQLDD